MEVKTSHFFACLDRLRLIQRWSLMRNIEKENLAEHSLQVAFVAQALAIIKNQFFGGEVNPERIAVMAMYHEICRPQLSISILKLLMLTKTLKRLQNCI